MTILNVLPAQLADEMSKKYVDIIEEECKKACKKFNCSPEDLIIQFHGRTKIQINLKASHFEIVDNFYYEGDEIKNSYFNMEPNKEDHK